MLTEQQQWRVQTYALLACLLNRSPDQTLLEHMSMVQVTEPESPMGQAWLCLLKECDHTDPRHAEKEFHDLFIGVTHGEIIPYGSYYRTGFLMEEPLANLRTDLMCLRLERQQQTFEPEDHIAALCDVMRLLLSQEEVPVIAPEVFFHKHMQPWVSAFCIDLQRAPSAKFYRSLAHLAAVFFELEAEHINSP